MSFLGGLFGGDTTVTTRTTVENNIGIDLENIIDTSGFENLLQGFKDMFDRIFSTQQAANEAQAAQGEKQLELSAQAQTLALLQTAVEAERNKELDEANQTFKRLAYGFLGIFALWVLWR